MESDQKKTGVSVEELLTYPADVLEAVAERLRQR